MPLKHLKLSLLTFFVVGTLSLHAQKWNKAYEKLDALHAIGDYPKANKGILKVEKKVKKKLGANSPVMATTLLRKAKYSYGLGLLTDVEPVLSQAIALSSSANTDNPAEHGYLLKEGAKIMVDFGNYRKAQDYVDSARLVLTASGNMVENIEVELKVLDAQILMGKGYYQEAINLVEEQTPYFQGRVASASKREEKPREEMGALLITKANALRLMGDYQRSDSAFLSNERWLDDELGKTHILYARNQYLNTKLLEENGLEVGAQAKRYEDAYKLAIRKYKNSHAEIMDIRESLLMAFYQNGNNSKRKIVQSEMKKTLRTFPRNSIHTLADDLVILNYRFLNENLERIEGRMSSVLANTKIPEKHHYKSDILEFAMEVSKLRGNTQMTERYLDEILKIKEHLYGPESPSYHLTKIQLANHYIDYTDKFDEAAAIYESSFNDIVRPEITEGHVDYLDILNHMAKFYEETDEYSKAAEILDEALGVARRKYDNKDVAYGDELVKISGLQIRIGNYKEAENNLESALAIYDELKGDEVKSTTAIALITKATLLGIKGEYDEAEATLNRSEKLLNRGALIETATLGLEENLAWLYVKLERLRDAQELLAETMGSKSRQFGTTSRQLMRPLVLESELLLTRGEYADAENAARRAYNISQSVFDRESSKHVPSMLRLAKVYSTIGDYDKAEAQLTNAISILKAQFGGEHVDVAKAISELALVKFYKDRPLDQVEDEFLEAEKIIGQKLGASNPTYAEVLKNLAIVNIAAGKYSTAFTYLDDAGRIWETKIGRRNNLNAATISVLKGDIYYRQKRFDRSAAFYEEARKAYQKIFDKTHPEYTKVQSKLAKNYYMQGDWRQSQSEMEEVLDNYQNFITKYFPALSEREKAKFWNTIKPDYEFYNTLVISKSRNEKYLGELFNNALLTKALLLNSSIKIRERITSSGDDELKELYADWINKKELLTAALSMSAEQQEENEIDASDLNEEVELLEKELSLRSEIFGKSIDQQPVTWEEVKASLNENEVALEMVRYRVFDHVFADSVVYAMLYVTGERRSVPQVILLRNGQDLEKKYLKYYRNNIRYRLQDTYSYDQFWKPIIDELGTVATLYLSPDGVYNQINLEAIPTPDGRYVLDNSNIILLSNTKELYRNRQAPTPVSEKQVAMLFGNPTFYVDSKPGVPETDSGLSRSSVEVVSQLPGTEKEINELKEYLTDRGWEIQDRVEMDATEPEMKAVESPLVFHVATHGFFQSTGAATSSLDAELKQNSSYENPLLKTGLLLTGAGDIFNQTQYNYNVDNGILTAYEAMNLNLDQTDLVVLSACETGLGEVEAGEGVYGLQRAFLVAGAKTIIMSLFKVSDEATQQLMVKFYRKWLESGDKRQAFIDAKKEIRNEFGNPIYWGPFIMVGLD
ncbi:MAG: CHAT domain-containing tetratricopeptide repeat protein [Bacteroidota bacterium]